MDNCASYENMLIIHWNRAKHCSTQVQRYLTRPPFVCPNLRRFNYTPGTLLLPQRQHQVTQRNNVPNKLLILIQGNFGTPEFRSIQCRMVVGSKCLRNNLEDQFFCWLINIYQASTLHYQGNHTYVYSSSGSLENLHLLVAPSIII